MKIVEYYTQSCTMCKMLHGRLDQLKEEHPEIELVFEDATKSEEARIRGIQSVPHIVVFDDNGLEVLSEHGTFATLSKIRKILS